MSDSSYTDTEQSYESSSKSVKVETDTEPIDTSFNPNNPFRVRKRDIKFEYKTKG